MIQVTMFHWVSIFLAGSAYYISCLHEIGEYKVNVNVSPTSGILNSAKLAVLKQETKGKQNISNGIVFLLIFIQINQTVFIGLTLVTKFQELEMFSDKNASR